MRVLVPCKRTIDYHLTARPNAAGTAVDLQGVKMAINPFDEIALEQALQLKEVGLATEVIVASVGETALVETLRSALAMGADRAIHLHSNTPGWTSVNIAYALQQLAQKEQVQLILCGKQAIDTDAGQVPSMLAELLGWPQADQAYKLTLTGQNLTVVTEADQGLHTLKLNLPAVITCDLRLNTPRLVAMPQIIKARTKPLVTEAVLPKYPDPTQRVRVFTPPQDRTQKILPDAASLAAALQGVLS